MLTQATRDNIAEHFDTLDLHYQLDDVWHNAERMDKAELLHKVTCLADSCTALSALLSDYKERYLKLKGEINNVQTFTSK